MPAGTAVFTIVAKNYLPYARVLMSSVALHHPEWRRFVILVDSVDGYFDPRWENFRTVSSEALPCPRSQWFRFKYSTLELSTAIKPYAFQYLFDVHDCENIIYLDPDIRLYSPLEQVVEVLRSENIALTPHLTAPLEDDKHPAEIDILRSGTYNLGFIGVRRSRTSSAFLAWWQQKLYDHCVVDLAQGLFVDQRWVDLAPAMFDGVGIIRDPGYNVAYWNLSHRHIKQSETGYAVEGSPLAFFHFSGYDATRPEALSKHQNRHSIEELPVATQEILSSYRMDLISAGYLSCRNWPYTLATFRNGVFIPEMCRPILQEASELMNLVEDPFSDKGFEAFVKLWNTALDPKMPGISKLAHRIYRTRPDVQAAMPDIFGRDYEAFLNWMLRSAKAEHHLDDLFLVPVIAALDLQKQELKEHGNGNVGETATSASKRFVADYLSASESTVGNGFSLQLTHLAEAIYQSRPDLQAHFPDPAHIDRVRFLTWLLTYGKMEHHLSAEELAPLREQWNPLMRSLPNLGERAKYELSKLKKEIGVLARTGLKRMAGEAGETQQLEVELAVPSPEQPPELMEEPIEQEFGVNLVGYFRTETGMGQSARAAFGALSAASIPTSLVCAGDSNPSRKLDQTVGPMSAEFPYSTNLFHVNADQTEVVKQSLGESFYENRHNIGYWAWELEEFPDCWQNAFTSYQEIWTPSTFCREAIGRKAPIPVFCVPHAVAPSAPTGMGREYFGLAADRFIFFTAFDVLSVMERKNPLGTIRAFQKAFGGDSRYQLIVKANNSAAAPKMVEALKAACPSQTVRIIESTLLREEMYALSQCVDCMVSLHRSEGFGFSIAEAMYFGKPVIVTNYSGNTDFTKPDNSLLVNFKLVPVGSNCEPYSPESLWADPDVDHAASLMRQMARSEDLLVKISDAGREFVRTALSVESVGNLMRRRLSALPAVQFKTLAAQAGAAPLRMV